MRRTLLKAKIHRATVTEADLHYVGSMTLDPDLMDAADLIVHERIEIYNITNGERFATYVIEGQRGSGEIVINGAAAHKARRGDLIIIASYADFENDEALRHKPTVVFVDGANKIVEKSDLVLASREPLPIESRLRAAEGLAAVHA
jgi:aspartate 1-decarboxylase